MNSKSTEIAFAICCASRLSYMPGTKAKCNSIYLEAIRLLVRNIHGVIVVVGEKSVCRTRIDTTRMCVCVCSFMSNEVENRSNVEYDGSHVHSEAAMKS